MSGRKIIEGLKHALRYSRCRHEFTYWVTADHNTSMKGWSRTCTKCKAAETVYSEAEPAN